MTTNLFIETAVNGVDCALNIEVTIAMGEDYFTHKDQAQIELIEVTSCEGVTIAEAQKWADANQEKITDKLAKEFA